LFWEKKYDILYIENKCPHGQRAVRADRVPAEERRLAARIARDTRRLAALRSRSQKGASAQISRAAFDRRRFSRGSYLSFIFDTVTSTRGFEIWDEALAFARRFRLLSTILRAASVIVYAVETGAAFIIAAGIVLAVLPAALLLFIAAHIDSLISSGRAVSRVRQIARECDVTFVFPPRIAVAENAFLAANTRVLAKNGAVFIVSPYLFSARGVGGKGAYSSLRYEGNGVYIIRRRTYFRLRRKLPQLFSLRGTTFIYL